MSISLSQKTDSKFKGIWKWLLGFFITDEIFAVASMRKEISRPYFFGLSVLPYFGWAIGTMLGALIGNVLPEVVMNSLCLAIYGMFIAIVSPVAKDSKEAFVAVLIAILFSVIFYYVPIIKEVPSGINIKSHEYLIRAGYIKQVSNGIYTLLPPAQKVSLKIQNIIRDEMDKVDGQEVLFPVVMPREMWDLSGRYDSIGSEMLRFKDRNNHDMLLGMTHEEAAVHSCFGAIKSYDQLPFMIYQIQTKLKQLFNQHRL